MISHVKLRGCIGGNVSSCEYRTESDAVVIARQFALDETSSLMGKAFENASPAIAIEQLVPAIVAAKIAGFRQFGLANNPLAGIAALVLDAQSRKRVLPLVQSLDNLVEIRIVGHDCAGLECGEAHPKCGADGENDVRQ